MDGNVLLQVHYYKLNLMKICSYDYLDIHAARESKVRTYTLITQLKKPENYFFYVPL
jgi:hypothetical protein